MLQIIVQQLNETQLNIPIAIKNCCDWRYFAEKLS